MLTLSSIDVWLLHSIISIILWTTFIGLVLIILGFGIYVLEKIIGFPKDSDKGGKKDG